ncbi:Rieske (2Fe-2S) protein [Nocardioides pocheonensis]|uniref:Rieske (2Fe-2S) protein n=1 Tax=Nocardioides pocheonensis TaxID=661485 RepID=UPI001C836C31|nr:Rieske (2Fe-2S) protein [Nocardioides pocheonensis]
MTEAEASRRNLLTGLAAAGVALPLVAACGSSGSDSTGTVPSTGTSPTAAGTPASGGGGGGGIKTSEIPVGGGKIFPAQNIVVTQPTAGQFKAFSAICTHQGCPVNRVAGGTIDCPCHGSQFSIVDGSVKGGLAQRPLPEKTVKVTGDTLTVT